MKVKTADLIDIALDWAVAQCEGKTHGYRHQLVDDCRHYVPYSPSTDWSQGGPVIEREKISVELKPHGYWMASFQNNYADEKEFLSLGSTPLIAAMRCFVASRLGDEVDVPEELVKISS